MSLAIGKEGQNARLAARLTGYKIDIKSESQAYEEAEAGGYAEDEYDEDRYTEDGYAEDEYVEDEYAEDGYADEGCEEDDIMTEADEEAASEDMEIRDSEE